MKLLIKCVAVIGLISSLSACGSIPSQPYLVIPAHPTYPTIAAYELECLSEGTMERLVARDVMKTERITTLENIIRTTHD